LAAFPTEYLDAGTGDRGVRALPSLADLEQASTVVHSVMPSTAQYEWPLLSARVGADVWVKHENHAPTGAFKVRGGLVYLAHLRRDLPMVSGIVCATRGNHGQSVGFAARRHGLRAVVVAPHGNSVEKNAAMRALGVELLERGHDFQSASEAADVIAEERGWHRMPSFHPFLVAGVGSYALELLRAVQDLDTVYVPIGLGSGICGMLAARTALGHHTKVVGVVSALAPAYARSFAARRAVSHDASTRIADGLACSTPDPLALELINAGVERIVEVTDDEVEAAMCALFTDTHNVAEGAGAAALAALMQERSAMRGKRVAIVVTGGNVDRQVFARVLSSPAIG
jgi:threonine dehydratase